MNKKILFIRPSPEKEQFGDESFLPLGLGYVAAILRKNNFDVKVLDLLIDKKSDDEVLNFINYFSPSFIGFSAVTPVVKSAYRLAEKIKKRFPNILLINCKIHIPFSHLL